MKIANYAYELVGRTPLLRLGTTGRDLGADLIAKLEYFNPTGSVKDRAAYSMLADAKDRGLLKPGTVVVEATSGNLGIALAALAASAGLKLILVIPDTTSKDKIDRIRLHGAEIVFTPGVFGMRRAFAEAQRLCQEIPGAFMPNQVANPANPRIHRTTTAEEIWDDTDGRVDIFVAGTGSGGTVTGVGEGLKARKGGIQVVAVEPRGSAVLSGGQPGPHKIEGIGPGFVPEVLNQKILDRVIQVSDEDAVEATKQLARTEGLFVGISSGAVVRAAVQLAREEENRGKMIVALLADSGERYLNSPLLQESSTRDV